MLSRRVFELAAAGCPIISTPSVAMDNMFGDCIISVKDGTEARDWCNDLQNNSQQRNQLGQQARDIVLDQHTWQHRLKQIKSDIGLN